jgi:hypothetical protein
MKKLLPILLIALFASCVPARSPYGCPKDVTRVSGDTVPEWMHISMRPKGFVIAQMALSVRDHGYCVAHLDCAGKPFPAHYKVGWCEGKELLFNQLVKERRVK